MGPPIPWWAVAVGSVTTTLGSTSAPNGTIVLEAEGIVPISTSAPLAALHDAAPAVAFLVR